MGDVMQKAAKLSYRVKYSAGALVGLAPLVLALLPGLAKGAEKVMNIIPENFIVGYIFFLVPALQVPIFALLFAVITQVGSSWWFAIGTWLFIAAQLFPSIIASRKVGPHASHHHYKLAQNFIIGGIAIPLKPFAFLLVLGSVACFVVGLLEIRDPDLGLDDILGLLSVETAVLLAVKVVLNFFKGKTFTLVMSSDSFMRILLGEARFRLMMPDMAANYDRLVVEGLTMTVKPGPQTAELSEKFPKGVHGHDDIKEMVTILDQKKKYSVVRRRDSLESIVQKRLAKALGKQKEEAENSQL